MLNLYYLKLFYKLPVLQRPLRSPADAVLTFLLNLIQDVAPCCCFRLSVGVSEETLTDLLTTNKEGFPV